MYPTISIITPSFNQGKFIEETIRSVIGQKGDFFLEYIIVDGGSTDGSVETIRRYAELLKGGRWPVGCRGIEYRWMTEEDEGIADAFNKGIRMSNGEVVGIINSDDSYLPGAFQAISLAVAKAGPDAILHGNIIRVTGEKRTRIRPRPFPGIWKYVDSPFNHPATFIPRRIYDRVGLYDKNFLFAMDYDFYLRAMLSGVRFFRIDQDLALFSAGGRSSKAPLLCHREVFASQKKNGLFSPVCRLSYRLKVLVNGIKRIFASFSVRAIWNFYT